MMTDADDARQLRNRQLGLQDDLGAFPGLDDGGDVILCVTTKIGTYPESPAVAYAVAPITLSGAVAEGAPVSWTTNPKPFLAANLGTSVPPLNTPVRVFPLGAEYAFIYSV